MILSNNNHFYIVRSKPDLTSYIPIHEGPITEVNSLTIGYISKDISQFFGAKIEELDVLDPVNKAFYERYILEYQGEYVIIRPKNALNEALYDL